MKTSNLAQLRQNWRRTPDALVGTEHCAQKARGFTLMELMVVTIIIGILASIGIPYFQNYVLRGNVAQAQPYILQIASQIRSFKVRTGRYYFSAANDEQDLEDVLGVNLRDAGDFCFMVVCRSDCSSSTDGGTAATTAANYIASAEAGDAAIEFEIWAVIRGGAGAAVAAPTGSCTVADDKLDPQGWARAAGAGSGGRVLVYRYPPPPDGVDGIAGHDGRNYDWQGAFSFTDALTD